MLCCIRQKRYFRLEVAFFVTQIIERADGGDGSVEIRKVPIDRLHPAAYNPRKDLQPGDPEYEKLARSIDQFDYVEPVIWNERTGNVVGGHQRLKVLITRGDTEIDVSVVNLSEPEEKALNVALNKISGEWDEERLAEVLRELSESVEVDATITGFDENEIEELFNAVTSGDEESALADSDAVDEVIEPPVTAFSQRGDMWICGKHRVMCGDSTDGYDVDTLMRGDLATMCFTDPPWNVAIGTDNVPSHRKREGLLNDNLPEKEFREFVAGFAKQLARVVSGDVYCVLGACEWPLLDSNLRNAGFHWSATIIWAKDAFVLGRSNYHRRYEPIWYGWRNGKSSSFCGRRDLDDVWEIPRPKKSDEHPTMKPVILVQQAIENSSARGDVVLDLFGGSGTTLIAAEAAGRRARLMELDPKFVDVIVRRYVRVTGKTDIRCVRDGEELSREAIVELLDV